MNTGTTATRHAAQEAWRPVLHAAGAGAKDIGEQILAVAHLVAVNRLAGPLTDPSRSGDDKAALAASLLDQRVDARVVELLQALVRGRWSKPVDIISALHDFGIEAILAGARAGGTLESVEQELFDIRDIIVANRDLRQALDPSRASTTEARVKLAESVFAPRVSPEALSLLVWCVRHRAEGGVARNLRRVAQLAAAMRDRVIADVVTAVPMSAAQEERLARILASRLGCEVDLNTVVDPAVIGGVKVTVRDEVLDSTLSTTLHQLYTTLAG